MGCGGGRFYKTKCTRVTYLGFNGALVLGADPASHWTAAEVKYDCSVIMKPQEDWPTDGTEVAGN